jgi:transposase
MIEVEFTEEEIKQLHYLRFNHPHPRVQLKMEVLYLKSQGLLQNEIAKLAKVTTETVRNYIKEFQAGGIESLKTIKFRRQESEMAKHRQTIREYFEANPEASLPQIAATIQRLTGLQRSSVQVSKFLQKEGLRRMKVGMIPAKADVEKQAEFLEKELNPRLEEAKKGVREVFF